jgi:hypothetical protein
MGKAYGVDLVTFQVLLRAAHMSNVEYVANAVHLKDHPEHNDFLNILKDPIFLDPIVSPGNLYPFLPRISKI